MSTVFWINGLDNAFEELGAIEQGRPFGVSQTVTEWYWRNSAAGIVAAVANLVLLWQLSYRPLRHAFSAQP